MARYVFKNIYIYIAMFKSKTLIIIRIIFGTQTWFCVVLFFLMHLLYNFPLLFSLAIRQNLMKMIKKIIYVTLFSFTQEVKHK